MVRLTAQNETKSIHRLRVLLYTNRYLLLEYSTSDDSVVYSLYVTIVV